jgi:hypothetical protein
MFVLLCPSPIPSFKQRRLWSRPKPTVKYFHVIERLLAGFGLMIGFIELLNNSWLHFTYHYYTQTSVLSLSQASPAAAWWRLPTVDVTLPLGFQTVPGLSYQLLTTTAHNNWTSAVL